MKKCTQLKRNILSWRFLEEFYDSKQFWTTSFILRYIIKEGWLGENHS